MNTRESEAGAATAKQVLSSKERLLERKVRAASMTLLFEKLWPRVWLPVAVAGVFFLLSVFEVWTFLPPRVHFVLLCIFCAGFVLSFVPLLFWRSPTREAALARLEQASALKHRPLTAFNDTLLQENPSPGTLALWKVHQARAAKTLKRLKAGAPHARTDKYDPFALRAALVLLIAATGSWAWGDLNVRLHAAFAVPELPAGSGFRIDAWISPPPYTGKEPFILPGAASNGEKPIAVPAGSQLTVKINGPDAASYSVALQSGDSAQLLEPADQASGTYAEFIRKIEKSATLTVHRSFGASRTWKLSIIPDLPPKIAFTGLVEVSPRGVMLFKYRVEDDYGVSAAEARIERVSLQAAGVSGPAQASPQIGKPPVFPLSLPRPPVKSAEAKTYRDLTAHPWAGLPVVVTLAARDEAGNEGYSMARGLILPERKFMKPLAREIASQRRSLVEDPSGRFRIAGNLDALAAKGADEHIPSGVYLNLRSAYWRLRGQLSTGDIERVAGQLWDAAIRIEDGNLSTAERDLRAAQEKLKDALERGEPPEEIQKLIAELRQALNRYLEAMMQRQRAGKSGQTAVSPDAKTISPQDLEKLLNRIENLAKTGSQEAAAQMLNELRDILESVQAGAQGRDAGSAENTEKLKQLNRLTDIMRQQQQLIDKTFHARQGRGFGQNNMLGTQQEGPGGNEAADGLMKRQEEVRKELQDLLSSMKPGGDGNAARRNLQDAEQSMEDASDWLGQNDLSEAGEQEGRALESLRQGTRAMAEEMARAAGHGKGSNRTSRDPLGRRRQDGALIDNGDSVKVPDEITVRQARRILDELRKRLGQPARPPVELDYLERLVKPY
jgi:uncharacterized protein (TIGR02302 family)